MTAQILTHDEWSDLAVSRIIEDQALIASVPADRRGEVGVMISNMVATYAPDTLAHWLTMPEDTWPVSDGVDTWEYDAAVAAWQEYLQSGHSGTDWFRVTYAPVRAEE